jgi:hypothetical protein
MFKRLKNLLHSDNPEVTPGPAHHKEVELHREEDCPACKKMVGFRLAQLAEQRKISLRLPIRVDQQAHAYLEEAYTHKRFPVLLPVCTIGRDATNDLIVSGDESISRVHFVIFWEDGYFFIADGGSKNGTLVNGSPITERTALFDEECICAGMLGLKFIVEKGIDANTPNLYGDYTQRHRDNTSSPSQGDTQQMLLETFDTEMTDAQLGALEQALARASDIKADNSKDDPSAEETIETIEKPKVPVQSALSILNAVARTTEANASKEQKALTPLPAIAPVPLPEPELAPNPESVHAQVVLPETVKTRSDSFPASMSELEKELAGLYDQLRATENRIRDCENRIDVFRKLKKSLLEDQGDQLIESCARVIAGFGWRVKRSTSDHQQLTLHAGDTLECLIRIFWMNPEQAHLDLGKLIISQAEYWGTHKCEPKGIFVMQMPEQAAVSKDLEEYAAYKKICLLTPLQLWCMFRELSTSKTAETEIRDAIKSASGRLQGFSIEH